MVKTFSEIITFANKPTGNGQIYSKQLLDDAFDIYMSKDERLRYGCLDAPTSGIIEPDEISHYLMDVWWKGDALWGEVDIDVTTKYGQIFDQLVSLSPESMTLGLAAMATFKSNQEIVSRDLFKDHVIEQSNEVDDMVVVTVYALSKSNTNH